MTRTIRRPSPLECFLTRTIQRVMATKAKVDVAYVQNSAWVRTDTSPGARVKYDAKKMSGRKMLVMTVNIDMVEAVIFAPTSCRSACALL
jgi:hypothetical protein